MFQCWSSLPCQRNPVHSGAGSFLCIILPSRWQGHYSRCQSIPLSQPPCLLLRESWRHFQRCGCPAAFWEMESFVSDRFKAMWRKQHWNRVTECQQGIVSLTITLSFVTLSPSSLSILSLSFSPLLFSLNLLLQTRDLKKVGVTIVGPQKKIVSSLKAVESHTKNGPVPV